MKTKAKPKKPSKPKIPKGSKLEQLAKARELVSKLEKETLGQVKAQILELANQSKDLNDQLDTLIRCVPGLKLDENDIVWFVESDKEIHVESENWGVLYTIKNGNVVQEWNPVDFE